MKTFDDIKEQSLVIGEATIEKGEIATFMFFSMSEENMMDMVPEKYKEYVEHYALKDVVRDNEQLEKIKSMSPMLYGILTEKTNIPEYFSVGFHNIRRY